MLVPCETLRGWMKEAGFWLPRTGRRKAIRAIVAPDPVNILVIILGIPAQNGRAPMPPFASEMNNQQIAALANYVRTSWVNMATPNAAGLMVSKLRSR